MPKLKRYVSKQNLGHIVRFDGYIKEQDKPAYLAHGDICFFLSTSGESFGIVLVEAMAACRGVVIAGDNPGYKELMKPFKKQLVDPKNTKKFSETIVTFLKCNQFRQIYSKNQKIYAQNYDIKNIGSKLLNEYLQINQILL